MPILNVLDERGENPVSFVSGATVLNMLNAEGNRIRTGCGGSGGCGLCRIRIESGTVHDPTATERRKLSDDQIRQGIRLACQVIPQNDLQIRILNPAPAVRWRNLDTEEYLDGVPFPSVQSETRKGKSLGVAVDLGTTHIRLTLWDMNRGVRIAGRSGLNPQSCFGVDILSRLSAATESQERASEIRQLAQHSIADAFRNMITEKGFNIREIGHLLMVGNTAMLALLTGKNAAALLKPNHETTAFDFRPDDIEHWRQSWGLEPDDIVEAIPPLGGWIGSDVLAGILSTHLIQGPAGSLLIDFGTNSEIALWDGNELWIASAAGGPAFEGNGISCGMPAEPGAIFKFDLNKESDDFVFDVIGRGEPKGICGSGLVDMIACLIRAGRLKKNGRFTQLGENMYFFLKERRDIALKKQDVDVFQRAKAAIASGVLCLSNKAGIGVRNLQRICICGAFGRFLNVANAQEVGLLPPISASSVELFGNTALSGCEQLMFDPDRDKTIENLKSKCRRINLSMVPEFDDLFIRNLYLMPMQTT